MVKFFKNNITKILLAGVLAAAIFAGVLGFVKPGKTVKAGETFYSSLRLSKYIFVDDHTVYLYVNFTYNSYDDDYEWSFDDIEKIEVWGDQPAFPVLVSATKASGAIVLLSSESTSVGPGKTTGTMIRVDFGSGFSFENDVVIEARYWFAFFPFGSSGVHPDFFIDSFMFQGNYLLPLNPGKLHYDFIGWFWDEECTIPYAGEPIFENSVLYAGWKLKQYTVTFHSMGGSEVSSVKQDALTAFSTSAVPIRPGYTFLGWSTSLVSNPPWYVNGTALIYNMSLYAHWELKSCTVTFNSNGGTAVPSVTQNALTTFTTSANPTKTGCLFLGWHTDSDLTVPYVNGTELTDSMTLYAKWSVQMFTVTFMVDGSVYAEVPVEYGTVLSVAVSAVQSNTVVITGLYSDSQMSTPVSVNTVLMSDMTVYAETAAGAEDPPGFFKRIGNWFRDVGQWFVGVGQWFGRNWLYFPIGAGCLLLGGGTYIAILYFKEK
ncbi:MAG: InlB B-repeat-containing protein [Firmicutes bacterium]|nr:InlB B-repeat-containing protein [Bacillota bacterium]